MTKIFCFYILKGKFPFTEIAEPLIHLHISHVYLFNLLQQLKTKSEFHELGTQISYNSASSW